MGIDIIFMGDTRKRDVLRQHLTHMAREMRLTVRQIMMILFIQDMYGYDYEKTLNYILQHGCSYKQWYINDIDPWVITDGHFKIYLYELEMWMIQDRSVIKTVSAENLQKVKL